jgi:hypothetical protein
MPICVQVWYSLVRGALANVAACARAGLCKILIDWFASTGSQPLLQIRIAVLLQIIAAHSIAGAELRALFRMMQPAPPVDAQAPNALLLSAGGDVGGQPGVRVLPHTAGACCSLF